jgi:hypothetical protein
MLDKYFEASNSNYSKPCVDELLRERMSHFLSGSMFFLRVAGKFEKS